MIGTGHQQKLYHCNFCHLLHPFLLSLLFNDVIFSQFNAFVVLIYSQFSLTVVAIYNDDDVKCLFAVMMIMMRKARGINPMTTMKDEVSRESITCNSLL